MYGVWSNNQTTGTQTISLGVYWGTNAAKASDTPIGVASPATRWDIVQLTYLGR